MNKLHINIDGKEYPVKFGLGTLRNYCQQQGIEFNELFDLMGAFAEIDPTKITISDMDKIAHLIECGIIRGCKSEGVDCDIDFDDIFDQLTDKELLTAVFTEFAKSMNIPDQAKNSSPQPMNRQQRRQNERKGN